MNRLKAITVALGCCLSAASAFAAEEVTTVDITDKVLENRCKRLGINIGGDASWGPKLKHRMAINFEGTVYRRCVVTSPFSTEDTIVTHMIRDNWVEILNRNSKGTFTILSGPSKGVTGKILSVEKGEMLPRWGPDQKEISYKIKVDQKLGKLNLDGVLIEALHLDEGQLEYGQHTWYNEKKAQEAKSISISHDVPPGSYGCSSLKLSNDTYGLRCGTQPGPNAKGTLKGSFFVKGASPGAVLDVIYRNERKTLATLHPANKWQKETFVQIMSDPPNEEACIELRANGDVLIDDIQVEMEGDSNPTAFRDDFISMMKDFRPGSIRSLQMGGSSVDNFLSLPLERYGFEYRMDSKSGSHVAHSSHDYSVVDYYTMCEYLDSEPWLNLPGTITPDQVSRFLEFLGAPADVGLGKLRAKLGHPKPFTETLKTVHVEFGNEIWNFADPYYGCGYNGPDHWKDMIEAGKTSKWYRSNVVFHVGGRAFPGLNPVPDYVPNADRFTWAPYILHAFTRDQETQLGSDENFLRWAFARAIDNALNTAGGRGEMFQARKAAKGIAPLSIYEISHHLMFIDGNDPRQSTTRARNVIQGSLGGGVNVANSMLMNLRYTGAFDQCYYSHSGGTMLKRPFDMEKDVYWAWSTHTVDTGGKITYNPCFLTLSTINRVIQKELLETVHSGARPVFGGFEQHNLKPVPNLDELWSYAFRDGKKRSLILVSLNLEKKLPVKVQFQGKPRSGAKSYLVTGDSFKAHNLGSSPQVKVLESDWKGFASGSTLEVPPASLLALIWEAE